MHVSAIRAGIRLPRALWTLFAIGLVLTLGFAFAGPGSLVFYGLLLLPAAFLFLILPSTKWMLVVPALMPILLVPQILPGVYAFDAVVVVLALVAVWRTFQASDRAAFDVRGPGLLTLGVLLAPLIALPTQVVSVWSFFGAYKVPLAFVLVFHSLRRVVKRNSSSVLLWSFPLVGTVASLQLFVKTQGIGGNLFARMDFRNFYTFLGWGRSDYIAGLLAVCLLGTVLLMTVERRALARTLVAASALVMLQGFLLLFSRAATVTLVVGVAILVAGWGGLRAARAGLISVALGAAMLATPGGQVILSRFLDPKEYISWYDRFQYWEGSWARFLAHPFTGIGMNQGRYQHDIMGGSDPHSLVLTVLMEQGVLGGLVLFAVLIGAFLVWKRLRLSQDPVESRTRRVAALAVLSAPLAHASVEPTITGHVVGMLYVVFLSWLVLQDTPQGLEPGPEAEA